ncbi:SMI1/KNR4 family protein [Actinacidiphila soli]|uniref:SMI1/KNR4 family protein n=1 Tax=Actinacidiphila soli TaxID=2487275 RepID=UPI000FC9BEAC|nr:SMI1/KNR4 family protein [Actinacidiphila soli]
MSSNNDKIAQAERRFGVRFPEDYRHFLATEGSMSQFIPPADDFLMINAIAELMEVNESGEFQKRFPGVSIHVLCPSVAS